MDEHNHTGYYRIIPSTFIVVRYCTQCGKAWRLPTQGDYTGDHGGSFPLSEWEEIKEPRPEWINTEEDE